MSSSLTLSLLLLLITAASSQAPKVDIAEKDFAAFNDGEVVYTQSSGLSRTTRIQLLSKKEVLTKDQSYQIANCDTCHVGKHICYTVSETELEQDYSTIEVPNSLVKYLLGGRYRAKAKLDDALVKKYLQPQVPGGLSFVPNMVHLTAKIDLCTSTAEPTYSCDTYTLNRTAPIVTADEKAEIVGDAFPIFCPNP
ncbi:hypothetical protein DSO57_1038394 [Entomophthora muscae]|uniref:Uncharacterized protein n=1 Tax=Entomophthora muscae TaxID=34485 RepID=A0ACC2RPK3_9FUNG|nr:hypothetical protein DSO57_1038394 [Entomophthora muscae]